MSLFDTLKKVAASVIDYASTAIGVTSAFDKDPYTRVVGAANAEAGHGAAYATTTNRPAWQMAQSVAQNASYAYGSPQGQYGGMYGQQGMFGAYGPQQYGPFNPYQQGAYNNQFQSVLNRGSYYQNYNQPQFAYVDMNAAAAHTALQGTINAPQLAIQRGYGRG